jgi:hypothetical protein
MGKTSCEKSRILFFFFCTKEDQSPIHALLFGMTYYVRIWGSTWMTLWLVIFVTLINHNITNCFLLSLSEGYFAFLYTCDIVIDQCHEPQYHPNVIPEFDIFKSMVWYISLVKYTNHKIDETLTWYFGEFDYFIKLVQNDIYRLQITTIHVYDFKSTPSVPF